MSKLTRTQKEKIRAALAMMEEAQEYRPILGTVGCASDAARLVRFALSAEDEGREHFGVALLDSQHRVRSVRVLFHGTIDMATVHPREVVRAALEVDAAAVLFFHNHPSGVSEPSRADMALTERLRNALALIEIRVLDHIIIAEGDRFTSFAERGLI